MAVIDVVVIGAGYAGLTAARALKMAGKSVVILEARDRVGGRIFTQTQPDGTALDLGGQWIGPGHDQMYALCREYGLETFPTHDRGKSTLRYRERLTRYRGIIPPLPIISLWNLNKGIKRITRLSRRIDLDSPWLSDGAEGWDSTTVEEWMRATMKDETSRAMFTIAFEAIFAAAPCEVSMLQALFYTRSNRDFEYMMNMRRGAQQDRIVGGAQGPCNRMAEKIGPDLQLNRPVVRVAQSGDLVTVEGERFSFSARRVIVAVPPVVAGKIHFDPPLPDHRVRLMREQFMGTVVKCYAIYPAPFWRERGLNGLCASPEGPISVTFDNSPKEARPGILMGFSLAEKARALLELSPGHRRSVVLDCFRNFLGDEALHPERYVDKSFSEEPWSLGCYAGMMPVGGWTRFGSALREPCGRIHWAGTETSELWNGYMEGAVRSGGRVAGEVLETL